MTKTQVSQLAGTQEKFKKASAEKALESIAKIGKLGASPGLSMIASCMNSEVSLSLSVQVGKPEVTKTFGKFEPIKKSES